MPNELDTLMPEFADITRDSMLNLICQHEIILKDLKMIKYLSEYTAVNIDSLVHELTELSNSMREDIDNLCTRIKISESL